MESRLTLTSGQFCQQAAGQWKGCHDAHVGVAEAVADDTIAVGRKFDMADTAHADETRSRGNRLPKIVVTSVALIVLALAIVLHVDIKAGLLVLVLVAVLPWLAGVVEQIEFAGVASLRLRKVQERVEVQELELSRQRDIIEQLVVYSMSWYLFDMLSELKRRNTTGQEYLYRKSAERDIRYLRDHGYLEHFAIGQLCEGENLSGKVQLTPIGKYLVDLRQQMNARQAPKPAEHQAQ
jgi:hypothetical protein